MIGEKIIQFLLLTVFLPLYLAWKALSWFVTSVFKEASNKIVKIVGSGLAISIIVLTVQYFMV
jgi:hypothetical protein